MAAIVFLGCALAITAVRLHDPRLTLAIAIIAILLGVLSGLTFPDIDQPLPLDHRSALTHSILPALCVIIRRSAWPAAAGLALGLGLHLAADVFPNAMIGYATVKMPFAGSIGPDASWWWLAGNALSCTVLGGWLLASIVPGRVGGLVLTGAIAFIGMAYLLRVDGGWPALAIYLAAGWTAVRRNPGAHALQVDPVRATRRE